MRIRAMPIRATPIRATNLTKTSLNNAIVKYKPKLDTLSQNCCDPHNRDETDAGPARLGAAPVSSATSIWGPVTPAVRGPFASRTRES